jgi:ABC-type lipoprotein release transport system permease subunit
MGPTFVATSIVVGAAGALVAALVAAAIPGWRAVRLRPGVALRTE